MISFPLILLLLLGVAVWGWQQSTTSLHLPPSSSLSCRRRTTKTQPPRNRHAPWLSVRKAEDRYHGCRCLSLSLQGKSACPDAPNGSAANATTTTSRRRSNSPQQLSMIRSATAKDTPTTSSSTSLVDNPLVSILHQRGYGERFVTLSSSVGNEDGDLPVIAEIYVDGELCLGQIVSITTTHKKEPRFTVELFSSDSSSAQNSNGEDGDGDTLPSTAKTTVVDMGQITTIWAAQEDPELVRQIWLQQQVLQNRNNNNDQRMEAVLDRLYRSRVGQGRSSTTKNGNALSKKQIANLVTTHFGNADDDDDDDRRHADAVLRKVIKTGTRFCRLVDSQSFAESMPSNGNSKSTKQISPQQRQIQQRIVAMQALALDAKAGGRLKRLPCMWVDSFPHDADTDAAGGSTIIRLINGGWLLQDQSVRATTEGRKLVERLAMDDESDKDKTSSSSKTRQPKQSSIKSRLSITAADERIIRRLECLAMGGDIDATKNSEGDAGGDDGEGQQRLEVDVRETLRTLQLPVSPQGAADALIKIGHWSDTTQTSMAKVMQPWSSTILQAASWYAETMTTIQPNQPPTHEGTISNLSHLPCVTIDAKSTTFRDDAISVRPRKGTGRRVIESASKWEILIHIVDVSDIYIPYQANTFVQQHQQNEERHSAAESNLSILHDAAKSRGTSRYDLPLGPLHLLPPVVLETLAFPSKRAENDKCQRCVTMWVYIDERNGRLLDAGLERTVVSAPVQLSYQQATALMEGDYLSSSETTDDDRSDLHQKARAILLVVERNLNLWSEARRRTNVTSQKREARLAARATSDTKKRQWNSNNRRQENTFQRTRGHRIVDTGLDLYSNVVAGLLRKAKAPIPTAVGADVSRGGRVATAPLRRYIDGVAQRQALAVLCSYGGKPLNLSECKYAGKIANEARNAVANVRAVR